MAGLPKLPGYTFYDPTLTKFHLSQTFEMCNGYKLPKKQYFGIGGRELDSDSVKHIAPVETIRYDPSLTYGRTRSKALPQYLPHFALYAQKALTFRAFFKQSVVESPLEFYRVRQVNIIYFLEDDSITVMEPRVVNCGLEQGRLVRRSKIPKYDDGTYWHWKDLQVGKDFSFYGTVYHTVDCDLFTREFMASQGLKMNDPEEMPPDPYIETRNLRYKQPIHKTPSSDDKLRRFLEYDGKVLKFKAAWDDRENEYGELMKFEILYFLSDDTVSVKNVIEKNSGRDPYPVLLRRTKLPKIYTDTPITYPACYLELSENEVTEYYQPKDFLVGNTIFVLGRDMILYDCDKFTRDYFKNALCIDQKPALDIELNKKKTVPRQVPPHDGIGGLEDSLQNTITFMPKRPKKDVVRQIVNANKFLRYEMEMDTVHPEDSIRRFILNYSLADGTCKIMEPPIRNSGIMGGKYLRATLLYKPGSDPLNPTLYTPGDFYIGAIINVFGQRFKIIGADLYVYRYMQYNSSKFPCEVIESMRNYMFNKGYLTDDVNDLAKERELAEKRYEVEKDIELRKTELEKCLEEMHIDKGDSELDRMKRQRILEEYEDSIKHKSMLQPYGVQPVNTECKYPIYTGEQPVHECREAEGQGYASYTPKHIDTPEEVVQKYYASVLDDHHKICDGRYPVECTEPPLRMEERCEAEDKSRQPKQIMVSPPDVPPEACKFKQKSVRFAADRCGQDRDDLCDLKKERIHCDCIDYKPNCKQQI